MLNVLQLNIQKKVKDLSKYKRPVWPYVFLIIALLIVNTGSADSLREAKKDNAKILAEIKKDREDNSKRMDALYQEILITREQQQLLKEELEKRTKVTQQSVKKIQSNTCRDTVINLTNNLSKRPNVALAVTTKESGISCTGKASPTNDCGPWQINIPSHPQFTCATANDPVKATQWAVPHLDYLIDTYGLRSGLAAYNAGTGGMKTGKGFTYADSIIRVL